MRHPITKRASFMDGVRRFTATPDSPKSTWADKAVDLVSTPFTYFGLGGGLVAPGGRYVETPLRQLGHVAVEGTGGALLGAGGGGLVGGVAGALAGDAVSGAALGAAAGSMLGTVSGILHGGYAARRQIRHETGDYNALGWGPDRAKTSSYQARYPHLMRAVQFAKHANEDDRPMSPGAQARTNS